MVKPAIRILGLVFVTALLAMGCAGEASSSGTDGAAPTSGHKGGAAPPVLRFDAQTVGGQDFSGPSLSGEPAVLWFWAAWCAICDREAEGVAQVAKESPDSVTFVGVAARSDIAAMQRFIRTNGVGSLTHIADVDGSVWQRFGITRQPAYAFIGPSGTVEIVQGTLSEQELTARVRQLVES